MFKYRARAKDILKKWKKALIANLKSSSYLLGFRQSGVLILRLATDFTGK